MSLARATVVYDLTVRVAELLFAADAWSRLESTFRFFDLVFLRRRNGGLVTRTGGDQTDERAISRIPDEVWEEIRYQLVQQEIEISQDNLLTFGLYPVFPCLDPRCAIRQPKGDRCTWSEIKHESLACPGCEGNLGGWACEHLRVWDGLRGTQITTLVKAFGLALGCSRPLLILPEPHTYDTALALLAAPAGFENDTSDAPIVTAECGGDDVADESTIVDISFDGLPLDIDSRFKRFVELFNLEVVDSSVETIVPRSRRGGAKVAHEPKRGADSSPPHGLRDRVTSEIKAKWRLCVDSEYRH
ncbi:hypothetical protein JCM3766R1_007098 [Sporobolomyces carnicolor]